RSVCAGFVDGLLIPRKGCARLDSLVIKASAGTLFRAPLLFCEQLPEALSKARQAGSRVYGLALEASESIESVQIARPNILVLGNESEGLSAQVLAQCDQRIHIPMNRGVESLNVAVAASLLAFAPLLRGGRREMGRGGRETEEADRRAESGG